jgi:signal transduction histidine kinase
MRLHLSIKQRIIWSFTLLACLFVVSVVVTNIILHKSREMSNRLTEVVDPSLKGLDDFRRIMLESKMYTTNWVFLRYKQEDKDMLKKIHDNDYKEVKSRLEGYSRAWEGKTWVDSLHSLFNGFEELLAIEGNIMQSLQNFSDYDDPVIKLEAERIVEDDILPRTTKLLGCLDTIYDRGMTIQVEEGVKLEKASMNLRMFTIILAIATICAGIFLSVYMTKVIVKPVSRIRHIVNDLGKGITNKINDRVNGDEIGMMVRSVNNLSDKLSATASFAHEVGVRNFDVAFEPLSQEDTLGKALITMRDNLKEGEEILEVQNRELERKNKELEQFAYVASHDLQEPLRTISSFVKLLDQQYKGKLDEKADKYLSYIVHSSDRMRTFITDLLEYSRIGTEKKMEVIDCNKLFKEVLDDLEVAIQETSAQVRVGLLPVIVGHSTEIKQLFHNLVFNAIKFRQKDVAPRINISATTKEDHWQFAVADNGIGIEKEHHNRIFIIFQRLHTRSQYPGSGIGLSHCKKIVELHSGQIWLDSELGKGSTFYFTIQRNQE